MGTVAVVEYLLEQGCHVDHADKNGSTPLHVATLRGSLEIAQLLFRWGVTLNVEGIGGKLPADFATHCGHHHIADAIRAEEIFRREHEVRLAIAKKRCPPPLPRPEGPVKVLFDTSAGSGNYIGEQALRAFPQARRQRYKNEVFLGGDVSSILPVKERVHLYVHPSVPPELMAEPVDAATVLLAFDLLPTLSDAAIIGVQDKMQYFASV